MTAQPDGSDSSYTMMACCLIFLTLMQARSAESSCTQIGAYLIFSAHKEISGYSIFAVFQTSAPYGFFSLFTVALVNPYSENVLAYFSACLLFLSSFVLLSQSQSILLKKKKKRYMINLPTFISELLCLCSIVWLFFFNETHSNNYNNSTQNTFS